MGSIKKWIPFGVRRAMERAGLPRWKRMNGLQRALKISKSAITACSVIILMLQSPTRTWCLIITSANRRSPIPNVTSPRNLKSWRRKLLVQKKSLFLLNISYFLLCVKRLRGVLNGCNRMQNLFQSSMYTEHLPRLLLKTITAARLCKRKAQSIL